MQTVELILERQDAIWAITQVIQKHAKEIDAYLRQESRNCLDGHPKEDVKDGDKTLHDIDRESERDCLGYLEDALQEWLFDKGITERQYELAAGDYDAREGILWDFVSAFAVRTKYQDLPTSD